MVKLCLNIVLIFLTAIAGTDSQDSVDLSNGRQLISVGLPDIQFE